MRPPERVPASPCPNCGTMLDGRSMVGDLNEATPVADDVTICIKCGGPAAFTADLRLRVCTEAELAALAKDDGFMKMFRLAGKVIDDRHQRR